MFQLRLSLAALVACTAVLARPDVSFSGLDARGGVDFTQLACNLSPGAQIYLPGSKGFNSLVARWSNLSMPVANVVVVPATENDVVQTVRNFVFALLLSAVWLTRIPRVGEVCKQQIPAVPYDKWCSRINHHSWEDDQWH